MAVAIHVESLGKRYRIGQRLRYHTLRDRLGHALGAPVRLWRGSSNGSSNGKRAEIWALRDVSFTVKQGEALGIPSTLLRTSIGHNGAGKSAWLV